MEDLVGLGTTRTVNEQSAHDRHMTNISVVSCFYRYASLGKWVYTVSLQLLPENGQESNRGSILLTDRH